MNLLPKLTPSEDAMVRTIGDETVILDLASGKYFGLDPVGTRCWHLITQGLDMDAVIQALLAEFEVDEARLRADLQRLLSELQAHGLLR